MPELSLPDSHRHQFKDPSDTRLDYVLAPKLLVLNGGPITLGRTEGALGRPWIGRCW